MTDSRPRSRGLLPPQGCGGRSGRLKPETWLLFALGLVYVGWTQVLLVRGQLEPVDFPAFYTGWAMARDGLGGSLYTLQLQGEYQARILAQPLGPNGVLPYVHPPYAVLPFIPLARLSLGWAYAVLALLQVVVLGCIVRTSLQIARDWDRDERAVMLAAVLSFPMLWVTIYKGQLGLLLLLCLLRFYVALKSDRELAAGGWVLAMAIKPHLMIFPVLMLGGTRRVRALAVIMVGMLLLVGSSLVAFGWQSWSGYFSLLHAVDAGQVDWILAQYMYNLRGALALLMPAWSPQAIGIISEAAFVLSGIFVLGLWWRAPRSGGHPSFEARWALSVLLAVLFSPHLFYYDLVLLIAPAVVAYASFRQMSSRADAYAACLVAVLPALAFEQSTVSWGDRDVRLLFPVMIIGAAAFGWMLYRSPHR